MTLSEAYTRIDKRGGNHAMQKLSRLQADLTITARIWAMDEVGAAVAHQLNEPLTALLIYLHEIECHSAPPGGPAESPTSIWQTVGMAMREAERACDMLEKMRQGRAGKMDVHSAVTRGRDAIEALGNDVQNAANARPPTRMSFSDRYSLTVREREVLSEIAGGATNKQGGFRLGISTRTFEVHRSNIMRKTGAKNAADLVRSLLTEG